MLIIIIVLLLAILLYEIKIFKIYSSCSFVFYWFTVDTFIPPIIYYLFLDGTSYKKFDANSFSLFLLIGTVYISSLCIITGIIHLSNFRKINLVNLRTIPCIQSKWLLPILVVAIIITIIYYYVNYGEYIPAIKIIQGLYTYERGTRPDVSGVIPHYFTFQNLINFVFPTLFLFYSENRILHSWLKNIWLIVIFFLYFVGGSQGEGIYFIIFLWIYKWKFKFNLQVLLFAMGGGIAYFLAKGIPINAWWERITYPFARFFVTPGGVFINYVYLIEQNYNFCPNIPRAVFNYIYDTPVGSAPTFYLGSLLVWNGYIIGMIIGIIIMFILLFLTNQYDLNDHEKYLYEKWAIFFVLYLLGNAGFSLPFVYRIISVAIVFFVIHSYSYIALSKKKRVPRKDNL